MSTTPEGHPPDQRPGPGQAPQPGWAAQPGQPATPDQPPRAGQPPRSDQPPRPGQAPPSQAPPSQPTPSGRPWPSYPQPPQPPPAPGGPDPSGSRRPDPGHGSYQGYPHPGHGPAANPGYGPHSGYDPQPGYGQPPTSGYGQPPQPGYDPQPGYGPPPNAGYDPQPGNGPPPNPGYGPYRGYNPRPGYGPSQGYGQRYWYPGPPDPRIALGLPTTGPGSLASRGQRLGARCLDWLFLLPSNLAVLIPAFVHFAHALNRFFDLTPNPNGTIGDPSQILSAELGIYAAFVIVLLLDFVLEGACTMGWGRTPGKRIVGIGPVAVGPDGRALPGALSAGRSWGRAASLWGLQAVIWVIDALWCLWDGRVQTLHDKAASTVVIVDDGRWTRGDRDPAGVRSP